MPVVTIEVPSLGNRTHLVHDGRHGVVVDAPRDLRAVEAAAEGAGVDLVAVADTHVHNDQVSGSLGLARRHGADYLLSADERVEVERVGVRGAEVLTYGALSIEVLATPGHTRHHQSFLVRVPGESDALLSGGSLLHGTVGRTDLVDPRLALHLAGLQWDSARAQAALAERTDAVLLPTHGFGSFCAGAVADADTPSAALTTDRAKFAEELVAGFGPVPAHYRHMDPLNRAGAGARTPRPARPVGAEEVAAAARAGRWVVDLRERAAHARAHLPGTVGVEYAPAQFATYVGWLVPWGSDLVLVADDRDRLEDAVRDLAGIGVEGVGVHRLAADAALESGFRRADWAAFAAGDAADRDTRVVLDVRQRDEHDEDHLPGAIHVPVQEIGRARLPSAELWVHCRSGYRAGIAASLLHRDHHRVVHVDDQWERVSELGIPTLRAA